MYELEAHQNLDPPGPTLHFSYSLRHYPTASGNVRGGKESNTILKMPPRPSGFCLQRQGPARLQVVSYFSGCGVGEVGGVTGGGGTSLLLKRMKTILAIKTILEN